AMVDGYQQKNDEGIAACLKHFAGYGAVNAGREYNDVEISQRTFLEQYVKPFRMALKAKPAMVMTAFNAIDRKPISGNKELLRDLLRDKEGFDGTVISDWGSIGQLEEQGVAADMDEAAVQAIEAGVDIDMMSPAYMFRLEELVKNGQIPESFIDESAFRVLMMKNQLGLFENPFAGLGKSGKLTLHNRTKAYQMASESCVLLKNEEILPLCQKQKVIWAGPYVTSKEFLSRWAIFGEHEPVETIEAILQDKKMNAECIPGCRMLSEEECKIWQVEQDDSDEEMDEQWLETITREDTVVCVLGEHESQSGEAASRAFLTLPEEQQMLFEKIAKRTDNIVTVVISGRPLDLRRISEKSKAVIMAWRPGTMGAEAITDLVYGITNPSGKLAVSIPWCVGQVPISYWDIKTGHVLTADNLENRFTSRYMDIPNTPLYPFGFGLSYTEFDISHVEVRMGQDKRVHVHCKVSNTGNVAGAEVVQCYYETLHASVVRPQKELVRFQKVFLDPGEKKNVDFYIDPKEFSCYDKNMKIVSCGMKLRISVGNSSDHEWGSSELYI
ncbi:MAG: glycoside hydrolase family 3 N-terminal domain-containing protein, partial [Lachnospiraceae bacterium]